MSDAPRLFIRRLLWNNGNLIQIARHGVTRQKVEDVCHGDPVTQVGNKNRVLVIAPTPAARILLIVLDEEAPEIYYPVTARPASRAERRIYATEKGLTAHDAEATE